MFLDRSKKNFTAAKIPILNYIGAMHADVPLARFKTSCFVDEVELLHISIVEPSSIYAGSTLILTIEQSGDVLAEQQIDVLARCLDQ